MEDWTKRMNDVMGYVELHLHDQVLEEDISHIMGCSYATFQSSFSQITEMSFADYVRKRKLSLAAYDLQNSEDKIIDIALKYGYESPDAFSVAFKRMHGITPTKARESGALLAFYCRLEFEVTLKGLKQLNYEIMKRPPFGVLGIRRTTPYGAGTWAIVKSDGSNDRIKESCGKFFDLGLCFGFDEEGRNDYMCGIRWDKQPFGEYDYYQYPKATWLRFQASGSIRNSVLVSVWRQINNEFLPQSKYRKCGLPTIEQFVEWNEEDDFGIVEIWIPVKYK